MAQQVTADYIEDILGFTSTYLQEFAEDAMQHDYPHRLYDHLLELLYQTQVNGVRIDELIVLPEGYSGSDNLLENITASCVDDYGLFDERTHSFEGVVGVTRNFMYHLRAFSLLRELDFETFYAVYVEFAARTPGMEAKTRDGAQQFFDEQHRKAAESGLEAEVESYANTVSGDPMGIDFEDGDEDESSEDSDVDAIITDEDTDMQSEYESDFEDVVDFSYRPTSLVSRDDAWRFINALPRVDHAEIPQEDRTCAICLVPFGSSNSSNIAVDVAVFLPCPGRHIIGRECMFRNLTETGPQCPFDRVDVIEIAEHEGVL
ncbi:hypothetical protein T440DRAFT_526400 [Plenodomus tracheiphilus IPT5]|uniref:RING-type domain-containing protein n=1 Tax=Plenodomus tracheiphilus IPT5 TaxID=1408161 RepID=A0A6A7BEA5_9PLEO|nr:hypothetical protein T440DRAFT_526400 [Plenodomus tracheiphilus IPT5]